jgi:hypothetical protein
VAGPDDLLQLLTQHWARDESVFPTEDDQHDVATVMLFQAYTGGRPAEFVHASEGRAGQDPLREAEEKANRSRKRGGKDHGGPGIADDGLDYDDDSDAGDSPDSGNDIFDRDDRLEDDTADNENDFDEGVEIGADGDSGYSSDMTDATVAKDIEECDPMDESQELAWQDYYAAELGELAEVSREYKALCYEDIILWVVRNPKKGERGVLVMEVYLRHHKGVRSALDEHFTWAWIIEYE